MKRQMVILLLALTIAIGFSGVAVALDVEAIQKGPSTAKKGDNVILSYEIKNMGSEPIYDVQIHSQTFNKQFEVIYPGETKIYKHMMHIPTDEEVKKDFGPEATVSNPFYVGGVEVTFKDAQGLNYSINSNSIEINLVSGFLYDYHQVRTAVYENKYYKLNSFIGNKKQSTLISQDKDKIKALKAMMRLEITAGVPKLINRCKDKIYLVPVFTNGELVGEIGADAVTGDVIGDIGNINEEFTLNKHINKVKDINTGLNTEQNYNKTNNQVENKKTVNDNVSVNEGSNNPPEGTDINKSTEADESQVNATNS